MKQKIDKYCPKCGSESKEYLNIVAGVILLIFMFPLGVLYLLLTPKYRCPKCKKLFGNPWLGTK